MAFQMLKFSRFSCHLAENLARCDSCSQGIENLVVASVLRQPKRDLQHIAHTQTHMTLDSAQYVLHPFAEINRFVCVFNSRLNVSSEFGCLGYTKTNTGTEVQIHWDWLLPNVCGCLTSKDTFDMDEGKSLRFADKLLRNTQNICNPLKLIVIGASTKPIRDSHLFVHKL